MITTIPSSPTLRVSTSRTTADEGKSNRFLYSPPDESIARPDEGISSIRLSRPDRGLSTVFRPEDILLDSSVWSRSDEGRSRPNGALSAVCRPDEGISIRISRPDEGLSTVSRPEDILLGISFSSLTNGTRLDGILSYHIDVVPSCEVSSLSIVDTVETTTPVSLGSDSSGLL